MSILLPCTMNSLERTSTQRNPLEGRPAAEVIQAFLERTEHSPNRARCREAGNSQWNEIHAIETKLANRPNPRNALTTDEKRSLMRLCDPELCNALPPIRFEVKAEEPAHEVPGHFLESLRATFASLLGRPSAAGH